MKQQQKSSMSRWWARSRLLSAILLLSTNVVTFTIAMWLLPFYSLGYYTHLETRRNPVYFRGNTNQTLHDNNNGIPTIFIITPTHKRLTQKVDLTSLCYTLMHMPKVHWILIEDSDQRTDLVTNVLRRCDVASTHLVIKRSLVFDVAFAKFWRGFEQRNLGLSWIRAQCGVGTQSLLTERVLKSEECNGVVYFADDDNKYDLRLFEQIRSTQKVSLWPVAFTAKLYYEGPICVRGKVSAWHTAFAKDREFPIDMAGFAVNLRLLLESPSVRFIRYKFNYMETAFLEQLKIPVQEMECRGEENKEILVWHVKTQTPDLSDEEKAPSELLEA